MSTKPVFFKIPIGGGDRDCIPASPPPSRLGALVGTGMFLFSTSSWPALDPTQFLYQSRLHVRRHPLGGDPRLKCRAALSPVQKAEYLDFYRHFVILALYIKKLCEKILTVSSCRQKG